MTFHDHALAGKQYTRADHPTQEAASSHDGMLEIGVNRIQHVTRLADRREFNHRAILKAEPIAHGKPLHVDPSYGDVLAHDTRPNSIAFRCKLLDEFDILDRNRAVAPAMLFMGVPVADKAVERDFHAVHRLLRHATGRDACGDYHAGLI